MSQLCPCVNRDCNVLTVVMAYISIASPSKGFYELVLGCSILIINSPFSILQCMSLCSVIILECVSLSVKITMFSQLQCLQFLI